MYSFSQRVLGLGIRGSCSLCMTPFLGSWQGCTERRQDYTQLRSGQRHATCAATIRPLLVPASDNAHSSRWLRSQKAPRDRLRLLLKRIDRKMGHDSSLINGQRAGSL